MDLRVLFGLSLEAALAIFLLVRDIKKSGLLACMLASSLILFCFASRLCVFGYETLDYVNFLSRWVEYFRNNGGFAALSQSVGNYNIPYLYFLAAFSYSDVYDLYLIKLLSCIFDVLLAWSSMRLVSLYTNSDLKKAACFILMLALPTVFLNGAVWGQCDVIYTSLAVLGVYLALSDRPRLSLVMFTLSFGFKLQAVFILPIVAVLMIARKIKIRHLYIIPLTYIILVLPAVIAGRPFIETITLYFGQTGSIGSGLNYNSSSVFAIFGNAENTELASRLGIFAAFAFMVFVISKAFFCRKELTNTGILAAAVLFSTGIPFLLPHMHDRYFFAADIFSLIFAVISPVYAVCAAAVQFASLLGYHAYLKMRYLMPMRYGAYALIFVLAFFLVKYFISFSKKVLTNNNSLL